MFVKVQGSKGHLFVAVKGSVVDRETAHEKMRIAISTRDLPHKN
jgi:hypothetical protein